MRRWENLLLVLDKNTSRVVFRTAWSEWPQMVPSSNFLTVRNYKGWVEATDQNWQNFEVKWPSLIHGLAISEQPIEKDDMSKLLLARAQSAFAWRWLSALYTVDKSTAGMIPGIDLASTPAEEELIRQERQAVKDMIKEDLLTYWGKIWNTDSVNELESIIHKIKITTKTGHAWA